SFSDLLPYFMPGGLIHLDALAQLLPVFQQGRNELIFQFRRAGSFQTSTIDCPGKLQVRIGMGKLIAHSSSSSLLLSSSSLSSWSTTSNLTSVAVSSAFSDWLSGLASPSADTRRPSFRASATSCRLI